MKKFSIVKKLQLAVLVVLGSIGVYIAIGDRLFYENMKGHPAATAVYLTMWMVLLVGCWFLFLDFVFLSKIKKDYTRLSRVAHSDYLSGIPNRSSCDVLLGKYEGAPIPEGFGCMMLEITNLFGINSSLGHAQGNQLIKEFSVILSNATLDQCFVGRNGGNKFLVLFEAQGKERVTAFLERLQQGVAAYNAEHGQTAIEFKYGVALNEDEKQGCLTDLIALANNRIYG